MMMMKAVMEHTIMVSKNTSPQPHRDCRTGWSVRALAWAIMP